MAGAFCVCICLFVVLKLHAPPPPMRIGVITQRTVPMVNQSRHFIP